MFLWILLLWVIATHNEWFQIQLNSCIEFLVSNCEEIDEEEEAGTDAGTDADVLPTTHMEAYTSFQASSPKSNCLRQSDFGSPFISDMDTYCQHKHNHWIRIFPDFDQPQTMCDDENIEPTASNANIPSIFYDRRQLKKIWEDPKNDIEAQWRRRILYESTPRGNVMMHYDAYREGFVYYSDQTSIPYAILNAVAMKYVMVFKCRDLFVDQTVYAHNPSPMIRAMREDDGKEQDKKNQSMHQLLHTKPRPFAVSDASPFVKFKSKQHDASNASSANTVSSTVPTARRTIPVHMTPDTLPAITNKFIYMGKFHNWTPLQSQPKKTQTLPEGKTKFDGLFAKADLAQRAVLDYKTYKLMKEPKK